VLNSRDGSDIPRFLAWIKRTAGQLVLIKTIVSAPEIKQFNNLTFQLISIAILSHKGYICSLKI
jgi:hypothetical protein